MVMEAQSNAQSAVPPAVKEARLTVLVAGFAGAFGAGLRSSGRTPCS